MIHGAPRRMSALFLLAVALATPPVDLRWRAPQGCPDAEMAADRLLELLPAEEGPAVVADVWLDSTDSGYRARVTIINDDARTERTITGRSCTTVADAAVIVVAVHVDALAVVAAPAVRELVTATPEPATPSSPRRRTGGPVREPSLPAQVPGSTTSGPRETAASSTTAPARPHRPPHVGLRVGVGAALRQVPAASLLASVGVGAWVRRVRVDLELGWAFSARASLIGLATKGADIALLQGAARVSWVPRLGRLEFALGGGVSLGDMIATGTGLARNRTRHDLWLALLADAGLVFAPIPTLGLFFAPELSVAVRRPSFVVDAGDGARSLYQPPVLGVRLLAGLEVRLR